MLISHNQSSSLVAPKNIKIKILILSVILCVRKDWYLTVMAESRLKLIFKANDKEKNYS